MVWISLIFLSLLGQTKELPKFLTKHSLQSLRYISADGRYAYIQKKAGVLGMVSSFRSIDFLTESSTTDFLVKDSRFKERLIIEAVSGNHHEFNLMKHNRIFVVDWGKTQAREIGQGIAAKLHLKDEWLSYYNQLERVIILQDVLTQKSFRIKLAPKPHTFFVPEVEMISDDTVIFTDVTDKGYAFLVQYNLTTKKSTILYRSTQTATKLELCQRKNFLAFGEFPYDDVARNSKIFLVKLTDSTNLAGFETIYSTSDSDPGNMICDDQSIFFIKTLVHNRKINFKQTEAVKLEIKTTKLQTVTDLSSVTQLVAMDGRILVPFRGDFYVLEGSANLTDDSLRKPENPNEELPLDL